MLIKTDRLVIKPLQIDDADDLFSYSSDPIVYKYQNWVPANIEDARNFIKEFCDFSSWPTGSWKQLGIYININEKLIGDVGLHLLNNSTMEIGFTLNREYQRKGYAYEAVSVILNSIKNDLGIQMVEARTDPENYASIMLLNKLGFEQVEYIKNSIKIRGEWKDDLVFNLAF